MEITRGLLKEAKRVVLYGPEGIGKTTFASKFPNPVFMDTERGTGHIDVPRMPRPLTWNDFRRLLREFHSDTMGFQTLVIDTLDWAEGLCRAHICAIGDEKGPKNSIEEFGWGKGYNKVVEEFGKCMDQELAPITDKGVNLVLVAHATLRRAEAPEEAGFYERWELNLVKGPQANLCKKVKEWAHMVLFANYQVLIVKDEDTKRNKAQGGKRKMYTTHTPWWDAKNRDGLADEIPFEYSAIAHCITAASVTEKAVSLVSQAEPEKSISEQIGERLDMLPAPVADPPALAQLKELMGRDGITEDEVRKAVYRQKHFPERTPIENFGEEYIAGRLIANWDKVVTVIKTHIRGGR